MEVKWNMAKDPVCGMNVDEKTAKLKSEYMDKTYYFCAQSCKATFDKNPSKFLSKQSGCSCGSCC
jgi:YHS domain-containing protein